MDPNTAWQIMHDADADPADRADAADALADWLDAGGFPPAAARTVRGTIVADHRSALARCRSIARTMDQRIRLADEHARMAAARAEVK
jgi:hypothetical protein